MAQARPVIGWRQAVLRGRLDAVRRGGSRWRPRRARCCPCGWPAAWRAAPWRNAASCASSSRRSVPPWKTLATKPPPGASTSRAKSSASSASADDAQVVGRVVAGRVRAPCRTAPGRPGRRALAQPRRHAGSLKSPWRTWRPAPGPSAAGRAPTTLRRAALHRHLGPAARRGAEIDHPAPGRSRWSVVELDQLEGGARAQPAACAART